MGLYQHGRFKHLTADPTLRAQISTPYLVTPIPWRAQGVPAGVLPATKLANRCILANVRKRETLRRKAHTAGTMTVRAALAIPEPPKQQKQWTHPVQTLLPRTAQHAACTAPLREACTAPRLFLTCLHVCTAQHAACTAPLMFLTCLHVCTHAVIYEIWWGFRETS